MISPLADDHAKIAPVAPARRSRPAVWSLLLAILLVTCSSDVESETPPNVGADATSDAEPSATPASEPERATEVVVDSFSDDAGSDLDEHLGERGARWAPHPRYDAGIEITSAGTIYNGTNTKVYLASGALDTPSYDVEADLIILSNQDHGGVVARADTDEDSYYAAEGSSTQGIWQLRKRVDGAWELLDFRDTEFEPGRTYHLRLELREGSQKFYVDGALVAEAQDSDPALAAPGRAGIRLSSDEYHAGDPTKGWQLDNFRVSAPSDAGAEQPGSAPEPTESNECDLAGGMTGGRGEQNLVSMGIGVEVGARS